MCSNVPYALREVLVAWEYGVIGKDTVQVRSLMHFIQCNTSTLIYCSFDCSDIKMLQVTFCMCRYCIVLKSLLGMCLSSYKRGGEQSCGVDVDRAMLRA